MELEPDEEDSMPDEELLPADPAPVRTDNSVRDEDGEQDVDQTAEPAK